MDSKEIAIESLGLAATQYNFLHKYLDEPAYTQPARQPSTSTRELLDRLADDRRFDGLFAGPGLDNFGKLFEEHELLLLEYWNAWTIGHDDPLAQFRESQETAVALLVQTVAPGSHAYNFFVVHLLTTSHAVRILLPFVPARFHVALVREWWLLTLAVYVAMLRPKMVPARAEPGQAARDRDWDSVVDAALNSAWAKDAHFVKGESGAPVASRGVC